MTNENKEMLRALNGGLDSFPEWRAALEKKVELQLRLQAIDARVTELNAKISSSAENDPIKKRAKILLDQGKLLQKTDLGGLRLDIADLLSERHVVDEAIRLQEREIQLIRSSLSAEICEEAAPAYSKIVERLATALIGLGKILDEERAFRNGLDDRYIAWLGHIRPMPVSSLGDPHDGHSRIAAYLQECCDYGFIEEKVIPRPWLDRWSK